MTNATVANNPGTTPDINILPIDAFAVTQYNTIGTLGGIKMPRYPAADDKAVAYSRLYPFLIISGTIRPPIAATAAAADPDIAPKNAQATIQMVPNALTESLKNSFAKSTRRLETPPLSMISPAKIKKGIAKSENESIPPYVVEAIRLGLTPVKKL